MSTMLYAQVVSERQEWGQNTHAAKYSQLYDITIKIWEICKYRTKS